MIQGDHYHLTDEQIYPPDSEPLNVTQVHLAVHLCAFICLTFSELTSSYLADAGSITR